MREASELKLYHVLFVWLQTVEANRLPGADSELATLTLDALSKKKSENEIVSDDKKDSISRFLADSGVIQPEFPKLDDKDDETPVAGKRRKRAVEESSSDDNAWMPTAIVCTLLLVVMHFFLI